MKIKTIETSRLCLRSFTREDARFAISIWNDPDMGQYLPDPALLTVDEEYLKSIEALGDDETCCYLIAESKTTGERIGTCSFIPDAAGKIYDIAYCVHKNFWRNGYVTEMAQGMVRYAKEQGAEKVTVRVNQQNEASNRIARKLGFEVVGETSYQKKGTDFIFKDFCYAKDLKGAEVLV